MTQSKNNVSALELKRYLGVRYKAAWPMKHKLLQVDVPARVYLREDTRHLGGCVEVDDAYLGGRFPGGKRGRGSENKVSFIAAVQTDSAGHPQLACVPKLKFTKDAIADWARKSLCASAQVVSDGLSCSQAVTAVGATYNATITGGGTASVKLPQFRAVNTFLGNLNTAFAGTYHSFDFSKYASRHLAEVQYRVNRRLDLSTILVYLIRDTAYAKPHPERQFRAVDAGGQIGCFIGSAYTDHKTGRNTSLLDSLAI